jgi:hypothetical protein
MRKFSNRTPLLSAAAVVTRPDYRKHRASRDLISLRPRKKACGPYGWRFCRSGSRAAAHSRQLLTGRKAAISTFLDTRIARKGVLPVVPGVAHMGVAMCREQQEWIPAWVWPWNLDFITDDCRFRFADLPEVTGAERIREFLANLYASIDSLSHAVNESWEVPGGIICHGFFTYSRKDGTGLRVPFSVILRTRSEKIHEYLIFADVSELHG